LEAGVAAAEGLSLRAAPVSFFFAPIGGSLAVALGAMPPAEDLARVAVGDDGSGARFEGGGGGDAIASSSSPSPPLLLTGTANGDMTAVDAVADSEMEAPPPPPPPVLRSTLPLPEVFLALPAVPVRGAATSGDDAASAASDDMRFARAKWRLGYAIGPVEECKRCAGEIGNASATAKEKRNEKKTLNCRAWNSNEKYIFSEKSDFLSGNFSETTVQNSQFSPRARQGGRNCRIFERHALPPHLLLDPIRTTRACLMTSPPLPPGDRLMQRP
jgi:hypothetical protein